VLLLWKLSGVAARYSRCTDAGQGLGICISGKRKAGCDRVSQVLDMRDQEVTTWNHYNGMFLRHQHLRTCAVLLQLRFLKLTCCSLHQLLRQALRERQLSIAGALPGDSHSRPDMPSVAVTVSGAAAFAATLGRTGAALRPTKALVALLLRTVCIVTACL
jgi:hypothetical protein